MSLNYEMARYTELTGEDGTKVPISRLGGFLDGYGKGRADKYQEITSKYMLLTEKQVEDIRAETIDDVIKKLAESEDTILTDKQYYTLIEFKEKKE